MIYKCQKCNQEFRFIKIDNSCFSPSFCYICMDDMGILKKELSKQDAPIIQKIKWISKEEAKKFWT